MDDIASCPSETAADVQPVASGGLTIAELRAELGLTQEEFGAKIGLANKASVSLLENGKRGQCSVAVAVAIEDLSVLNGVARIDAAALCDDVRLARAAVHAGEPATPPALCANGQSGEMSGQSERVA